MNETTPTYDDTREEIIQRYRRRAIFVYHFALYLFIGLPLFLVNPHPARSGFVAFWTCVLVLHGIRHAILELRDRALDRAKRQAGGAWLYEKLKRGERLTVSDDGELVEVTFSQNGMKAKNGTRM